MLFVKATVTIKDGKPQSYMTAAVPGESVTLISGFGEKVLDSLIPLYTKAYPGLIDVKTGLVVKGAKERVGGGV